MAKIIKLKDLLVEQPPKPPAKPPAKGDSGNEPPKPQPVKTDIPASPFEPDVSQIKDKLKQILKQWQVKQYPSDEIRWKMYHRDILKLVKQLTGDKE